MSSVRLVALACLAAVAMPACDFDDLGFGEVVDFSQSNDPAVKRVGEVLPRLKAEEQAELRYADFQKNVNDTVALEEAIRLQPDNARFRAMDLVMTGVDHGEETGEFNEAKRELLAAAAKSLPETQTTRTLVRDRADSLLRDARETLLGQLAPSWRTVPPPRYDIVARRIFEQYCRSQSRPTTPSCRQIPS